MLSQPLRKHSKPAVQDEWPSYFQCTTGCRLLHRHPSATAKQQRGSGSERAVLPVHTVDVEAACLCAQHDHHLCIWLWQAAAVKAAQEQVEQQSSFDLNLVQRSPTSGETIRFTAHFK